MSMQKNYHTKNMRTKAIGRENICKRAFMEEKYLGESKKDGKIHATKGIH